MIKSVYDNTITFFENDFNSSIVWLKAFMLSVGKIMYLYFNSSIVWLKDIPIICWPKQNVFQFKYCVIKRYSETQNHVYYSWFQFKYCVIKSPKYPCGRLADYLFQFKYCVIKRMSCAIFCWASSYFNSSIVWLKDVWNCISKRVFNISIQVLCD